MKTVLVTGASRGLGRALVEHYAGQGWRVIACCRNPEKADTLKKIAGDVLVRRMDVTRPDQIQAIADEFRDHPIDLLINNAGVFAPGSYGDGTGTPPQTLGSIDYDGWLQTLSVNALGPVRVAERLLPSLTRASQPIVVSMGSSMGSVSMLWGGNFYALRSSKAALHMAMAIFARDVQAKNVISVVVHPGWMKTDMGGADAPVDVADSVHGLTRIIDRLRPEDSGRFYQFDGAELPW